MLHVVLSKYSTPAAHSNRAQFIPSPSHHLFTQLLSLSISHFSSVVRPDTFSIVSAPPNYDTPRSSHHLLSFIFPGHSLLLRHPQSPTPCLLSPTITMVRTISTTRRGRASHLTRPYALRPRHITPAPPSRNHGRLPGPPPGLPDPPPSSTPPSPISISYEDSDVDPNWALFLSIRDRYYPDRENLPPELIPAPLVIPPTLDRVARVEWLREAVDSRWQELQTSHFARFLAPTLPSLPPGTDTSAPPAPPALPSPVAEPGNICSIELFTK